MERTMKKCMCMAAVVASLLVGTPFLTTSAHANGVQTGVLTCNVAGGWGYIIASSRDVRCNYMPNSGPVERYTGTISKLGVDIGHISKSVIVWDVVAPSSDARPGALEGTYAGATADAAAGVGGGANVLLGGLEKSIALQPVSVAGEKGVDIAAGIGALKLKSEME
jgi:hypothetical protein